MTPLHWAVERGCVGAIEVLLKHGASPDLESKFGKSALDIASDNGRPDLYEMLLVRTVPYLPVGSCSFEPILLSFFLSPVPIFRSPTLIRADSGLC